MGLNYRSSTGLGKIKTPFLRVHTKSHVHQDPELKKGLHKSFLGRKWHPTPVFLLGKSHGQRSPVGYSPWGHKESDMTKQVLGRNLDKM